MELNMMDWGLFNKHTQREESMDEKAHLWIPCSHHLMIQFVTKQTLHRNCSILSFK